MPGAADKRKKFAWPGPASAGAHLAAEGKAARTQHTYSEAVRWFAEAYLLPETAKTRWEQVDRQDLQH